MGLLARVDAMTARNLTALPATLASSVVDSTLGYVREKTPDELLPAQERRARLAAREAELLAECERVEAEAASVLAELRAQMATVRAARRDLEDEPTGEMAEEERRGSEATHSRE